MILDSFPRPSTTLAAVLGLLLAGPAVAIQTCELDGQSVNPNNGSTTAGRSGLMRCRDADSGVVTREQELRNGKFFGVERFFRNGELERERNVNERGNADGLSREWAVAPGTTKRVLVREETSRNGQTVGVAKSWYPNGQRRRLTFYGDDGREQASVEFTEDGKLYALRCTGRAVFATDFDDKAACGFAGAASTVITYGGKGQPASRITFDRGERRKTETLWDSGAVREVREITAAGGVERSFSADGTKRHELHFATVASTGGGAKPHDVNTLEQDYHESGKLIRERRWTPSERGADLVSDTSWFLNGQMQQQVQYVGSGGRQVRKETGFHDNGATASEGIWVVSEVRGDRREVPAGTHKTFDDAGHLRSELVYDDKGRLTRERAFDPLGGLVRDDEVFEDGSRKSVGR